MTYYFRAVGPSGLKESGVAVISSMARRSTKQLQSLFHSRGGIADTYRVGGPFAPEFKEMVVAYHAECVRRQIDSGLVDEDQVYPLPPRRAA